MGHDIDIKIKPVVSDRHTSFEVDFHLGNNITLISGKSCSGRSLMKDLFRETLIKSDKALAKSLPIVYNRCST